MSSTKKERCIIIPAIRKTSLIPDQFVKKLAGVTLIQRTINTAKNILPNEDIYIVTDSEEITLICTRNNVRYYYDGTLRINNENIFQDLQVFLHCRANEYENIIVYFGLTPLITHNEIEEAYQLFITSNADLLVTLKKENHRFWKESNRKTGFIETVKLSNYKKEILVEANAFKIIKATAIDEKIPAKKVIPYYLKGNGVEIKGYDDWWVCEKFLKRKRIVFVVAGYPAIGMGHVFRSLTLAHEISDHEIYFLCTKNSDLAAVHIAEKDYPTMLQSKDLLSGVISLHPDLVINDILDTDYD